ncbi:MAG: hypothetical protein LBU27_05385, partial [Candidatus Peribacteria bacterium]|nr:hypothetical protein [Candidatus Peribacteria bacterium]
EQNNLLESIISRLENADTISAMGWNVYEKAREEILIALPENLRRDVSAKFAEFELSAENLDSEAKRTKLNEILGLIANNAKAYDIPTGDLDGFYLPQFCKIFGYYELVSDKCTTDPVVSTPDIPITQGDTTSTGSGLPTRLKVIIRIILGGILIMGGIIVFFAIKARLKANAEDEEDTEEE